MKLLHLFHRINVKPHLIHDSKYNDRTNLVYGNVNDNVSLVTNDRVTGIYLSDTATRLIGGKYGKDVTVRDECPNGGRVDVRDYTRNRHMAKVRGIFRRISELELVWSPFVSVCRAIPGH